MKIILVPTDFSRVGENAINYAAEIGVLTHAKLILFHAFHTPIVPSEIPTIMPDLTNWEKDCNEELKKIERKLYLRYGKKLSVECVCKMGFAVGEINRYASAHKVDLIIIGMQGAGYLAEKLIGSTMTSLIHQSGCPLLVIDKGITFHNIKKIALACDYEGIENKKIFAPLREIVNIFKSHVYVLNIVRELNLVSASTQAVSGFIKLEHSLAGVDHSFHYLNNKKISEGINEFVTEGKMDMVVMIPHKHSALKNIFREGNTKRMAFHSKVPLLTLH